MNPYPPAYQGPYVAPPERGYSGSGGGLWTTSSVELRSGSGSHSPVLHVKVADTFKLPPPIDFTKYGFREVRTSGFEYDFEYERRFLDEHRQENADDVQENGTTSASDHNRPPIVDPWEQRIAHFVQMGHSRETVCMALIAHVSSPDEQVLAFLAKYEQLLGMGFQPFMAAAALLHHREELDPAIETCCTESCG